jgi:hypothetical protein
MELGMNTERSKDKYFLHGQDFQICFPTRQMSFFVVRQSFLKALCTYGLDNLL